MTTSSEAKFKRNYQIHLQHLRLKGLQPKTIDAYSRAIRRIGDYFDHQIDALSEQQLLDYFSDLLDSHSWSAVWPSVPGLQPCKITVTAGAPCVAAALDLSWIEPPDAARRN